MIRNNLSWINLNAGSSGGSGGGGVSDYNDLANRPIISMTGTSQNPLKLWNLSTGLYLLNGYVYYNTTNTRECVNLFVSITAQIQNGKYVLSAFVPSWEGHYEYIKANSTSTDYTDTQILKMLTEDDVLTLTNEVEYTPTTDYHPSTKKYVDEAMQSVMEEFAKMGVNEQDIKTLIAENRRRDIAIQALLNETADKNVTIEEDTHTISLDYSMEDGMAIVNSIEGSTLVNVSKTVDEVYVTKSQDRVEQTKVANTIGEQNGKLCPIIEGDTLVNVCNQKDPIAITKSYTVENSGNHIALQGEYDGSCRPVIQGNTLVNLFNLNDVYLSNQARLEGTHFTVKTTDNKYSNFYFYNKGTFKPSTKYTLVAFIFKNTISSNDRIYLTSYSGSEYNQSDIFAESNSDQIVLYGGQVGTFVYTLTSKSDISNYTYAGRSFVSNISGTPDCELDMQLMIFEGDLTQTPELIPTEYVEGLKSSFEDNVVTQAMVDRGEESAENLGKYKVEYKVTGKNKLDMNNCFISYVINWSAHYLVKNNIEYIEASSNTINITDNTQYIYVCFPINIKKGYTYNLNYTQSVGQGNYIKLFKDMNKIDHCTLSSLNYKGYFVSNDDYKYICFPYNKELSLITLSDVILEEGTEATPYEPYKEYTKTFYLNSPLLEGDTIEDINGVATHVKRYEKVVFDGSENWFTYDKAWGLQLTGTKYNMHLYSDTLIRGIANKESIYSIACLQPDYIYISLDGNTDIKQWLSEHPTTVVYQLASPIYEKISTETILCDSYVNGHLDFDSAVPVEKVEFKGWETNLNYLCVNTVYNLQFESDNIGELSFNLGNTLLNQKITKGVNKFNITIPESITNSNMFFTGIGFNASNIVVTEATDKDFDYFNGIQSTFEENLVTDENNPHYGKYRVIYRTKSSDGNASTVKSVYLNSPLLQGDKLVVVNGKLCHYHKMGMVVLDGSESWTRSTSGSSSYRFYNTPDISAKSYGKALTSRLIFYTFDMLFNNELIGFTISGNGLFNIKNLTSISSEDFKQWLQANPTTVVYELEIPYYEEISSNPKDAVVDFYANGTLEVQSAVYPLSMEFTSFEEELTYLYASTVYTVQFEANGNAIANITLGGATVTNQEIIHGLNRIQITTPSTLVDNKLIIDGCGNCKISNIVVTNSTEEFEYFEGMKSAFEDKQNEDGTYTVEIVVYNAPIRLNKDKE